MRRAFVEADDLAFYWIDRIERLLRAAVRDAHLIPADQRVDVEFGEFMADDLAMAARIFASAGIELTDTAGSDLQAYLAGNPRGKEGRIIYDIRNDFGLDPDELHDRFAFYFEAFPQIQREVL
jgi:hypothetical protein